MFSNPLAYYLTFTTHGTWLHGDPRKSIIRRGGKTEIMEPNTGLYLHEQRRLKYPPVTLETEQRFIVLQAILNVCKVRKWRPFALHVRSNHVHAAVGTDCRIDLVMDNFKRWSSRKLRENGFCAPKIWTLKGSQKYIFKQEKLLEKIHYVIYEQGAMMAYYIDEQFRK